MRLNYHLHYISLILSVELFCFSKGEYGSPCNSTINCEKSLENSVCTNKVCQCKRDHFLGKDDEKPLCIPCPALGEHCDVVQCCRHSSYLTCSAGYCRCRNSYDGIYCWNASSAETVQFESIAQMILGLALVFTIAVLGSLVWRLCARQDITQHAQVNLPRDTSFASLNSVQRLVLIRLQDRPPPYNPSHQPRKYYHESSTIINNQVLAIPPEAPPPYTITVTSQIPMTLSQTGLENPVFSIDETLHQLQQSDTLDPSCNNNINPTVDKDTMTDRSPPEYLDSTSSENGTVGSVNSNNILDKNEQNNN